MPPNVGANRNWDIFPGTPIAGHRPSPGSPWPRQRARIPSEAIGTTHSRGSRFTSNPNGHVHVRKVRRNSFMAPLAGNRTTRLPLNYLPRQLPPSPTTHEYLSFPLLLRLSNEGP